MSEHPVLTLVRSQVTDPSLSFTLIGELEAQTGRGAAVEAEIAASQAVELTRAEPGCVAYDLCRDTNAPDRFVAYESWRDLNSLREHLAAPHFNAISAALGGLLASAPTFRVLTSCSKRAQR